MLVKYTIVLRRNRDCWLAQYTTLLRAQHEVAREPERLTVERWEYPVLPDGCHGEPVKRRLD